MPELPEVETIRRQLEKKLTGLTISNIEVRLPKQFVGDKKEVIGKKIDGIKRRGKMLIVEVQSAKCLSQKLRINKVQSFLVVHLKLTGQLVYVKKTKNQRAKIKDKDNYYFPKGIPFAGNFLPGKTTHIIFTFSDGSKLFFNDNRQFGWIKVIDQKSKTKKQNQNLKTKDDLFEKLGPEPFSKDFTVKYLEKIVEKSNKPIKVFIMEQDKIAGIGNIYANEALFLAGISPLRKAKTLNEIEIKKLFDSILFVLKEGIYYQGSSGKDESYVNIFGEGGKYQEHFKVYQRNGKPCLKCKEEIKRITVGGRGTYLCLKCQR